MNNDSLAAINAHVADRINQVRREMADANPDMLLARYSLEFKITRQRDLTAIETVTTKRFHRLDFNG